MRIFFSSILLNILCTYTFAQKPDIAFIKIVSPARENNSVKTSKQFITGLTCPTCTLSINGTGVTVYNTGAFAYEVNLAEGDTMFNVLSNGANGKVISKKVTYAYQKPAPAVPVSKVAIESIETFPDGNLLLQPGDAVSFRVKALPGSKLSIIDGTPLFEQQTTASSIAGIYQGSYVMKAGDNLNKTKPVITLTSPDGFTITSNAKNTLTLMTADMPDKAVTKSNMAYMDYGLGEDRLGGAKIGYLDQGVQVNIIGKVNDAYKIRLAQNRTAFIPGEHLDLLPKGAMTTSNLTGSWKVYGDETYDYVTVGMPAKLPYQSKQLLSPSRLVIDVFGAVSNTNWITQLQNTKEVTDVDYEQVSDDIFRIYINLKHAQHWGHQVYYNGNILVIKIKQQPAVLALNKMTIAVDAGHGGSNDGATGITGAQEKSLTLAVALKLEQSLKAEGVNVQMTRNTTGSVQNEQRFADTRKAWPDLLISIHLNSAGDPLRVQGTSTYYNHIVFKPLSAFILTRMLELGLKEFGNIGAFNFILNRPTEFPNALVETVFISNPEDESKILDPVFQQQIADKIVLGIKDFLANAAKP
ncbi:MAG: N-acetylmuramoyl-L-alanine amidase [Ferruginibacter sp.]